MKNLLLLVPFVVVVGFCWGLVTSASAILGRAWPRPATWVRLTVLAASAMLLVYGFGLFRGAAYDKGETCEYARGQRYDPDYVSAHHEEQSRWFPLHSYCNADYDLVPAWVNPSVVVLASVAVGAAGVATVLALRTRRREPRTKTRAEESVPR